MQDSCQKREPPVPPAAAGVGRAAFRGGSRWPIVLIFALGFLAASQAAEPDATARRQPLATVPRTAPIEQALTDPVRTMAQAPELAPTPRLSRTDRYLAVALLLIAAFAAPKIASLLEGRFTSWFSVTAGAGGLEMRLLEEPSVVTFFESLHHGPTAAAAGSPTKDQAHRSAPAPGVAPDRLREFYDSTPSQLAELRTLFSEMSRAPDEAARQEKLLESFHRVGTLREGAELPELLPVWQVAFALEGLLKRLSTKAADVTPSVLRTAAGAVDLLGDLCRLRVRSDLATEPPVRLLAVDDDPISRRAMSLALAKLFKEPDLAPDGRAALELAGRQTYDVIFLDVEMPGMDGFELCTSIHETALNPTTPVVFVTRHGDFDSRAKSSLSGGSSLLGKPFIVFELVLKAITLALQGRLGQGTAELLSGSNGVPAHTPVPEATLASEAPAGEEPDPQAGHQVQRAGELNTLNSSLARGFSAPLSLSSDTAHARNDPARKSSGDTSPSPVKPPARGLPKALAVQSLAHLQGLQERLQAAQHDGGPDDPLEFLGELCLGVHAVCAEAQRAELGAAFRLGSALESLLKKLLEQPNLRTPGTVRTAAAALDLLMDLCRTGANPDLAHPPIQLLVVDDDPVARRAISGSLQLVFGRPDSAESGEAALRLATGKAFDLMFLDVRMPGMDGFAACSRIHQTRRNRLTPVVFVTSHDDVDSRSKASAFGGCGFIPKPVLASQITLVALTFVLDSRLKKLQPAHAAEGLPEAQVCA